MSGTEPQSTEVLNMTSSPPPPDSSTNDDVDTALRQTDAGVRAARALFIVIFIVIGFIGNSVLVATIAQSNRLRQATLNLFILSIASVNILDSVVNLPLILGASLVESWDYGTFVCQLNASCLQLASVVMLLGLMMMTSDRFLALRDLAGSNLSPMSIAKANLLIVYSWAHGLALCLVLLINIVPVSPHPARYLCSLSPGANLIYVCFVSTLGYILPLLLIFCLFVYIIKSCISEKLKENQSSSKHAYDKNSENENRLLVEINAAKLIGILLVLWCICEGPHLLLLAVEDFRQSDQLMDMSGEVLFPWQLKTAFTWLRLSYVIVLPIVSFLWCKEVWQKLKKRLTCNNNLIKNIAPKRDAGKSGKQAKRKETEVKSESRASLRSKKTAEKESRELSLSNGSVPVLFATANGLHYQSPGMRAADHVSDSDGNATEADTTDTTLTQVLTSRKCDVAIGGDETSDYDSQAEDPFATSNPISIRSKNSNGDSHVSRNGSHGTKGNLYDEYFTAQNETRKLNKRSKHKEAKGMPHLEQLDLQQTGSDDKTSHDSGTDSLQTRRKFQKETRDPIACEQSHHDSLDKVNGNLESSHDSNNHRQNETDTVNKPKKRRKKKKRRQTDVEELGGMELSQRREHTESPAKNSNVPLPRLLPKLDIQRDSTEALFEKVADSERSKGMRALPELPGIKSYRPPYRQLSDNTEQRGVKTEAVHGKPCSSDDTARPQSARPVASPRKSAVTPERGAGNEKLHSRDRAESRTHLLENGCSVGYVEENEITNEAQTSPARKTKRRKRIDV